MNSLRKLGIVAIFALLVPFMVKEGRATDIGNLLFHGGITVDGHSGLLFTKAGTSVARRKLILGFTPSYFDRGLPGGEREKKVTLPLTLTYGLPYNLEFAGRVPYVSRDNSSSESGLSEVDLSLKWSFLQKEGGAFPSLAAGVASKFGIGDKANILSDFEDFSLSFFLSGTALIDFGPHTDYALSLYGEGGAVLNDWGGSAEEKHGEYSLGVLFPFPSQTSLGLMLEFGGTVDKGFGRDADYIRLTPSCRLNYKKGSFTIGVSLVDPRASGMSSYADYTFSVTLNI